MPDAKRIAVIGGGPIGVEAALYARAAGHEVVLYERDEPGQNMAKWKFVQLFTPWAMNTTPLGRRAAGGGPLLSSDQMPTGAEFLERYLLPLARSAQIKKCVESGVKVLAIGRDEPHPDAMGSAPRSPARFRILVCDRFDVEQIDHADVVLDCSGTYGNSRWAGKGGVPAIGEFGMKQRILYTVPDVLGGDRYQFADRHTLLVGTGTSAASLLRSFALLAAEAPNTKVTWAFFRWGPILRLIDEDPLPGRRALAEWALQLTASPPPWLELLEDVVIESFNADHGLVAVLRQSDHVQKRHFDEIVTAVGYRPDESLFQSLEAHPTYVNADETRAAIAADAEPSNPADVEIRVVTAVLNYYILGAKSYGCNSNFLMRIGHLQIREAFRQIAADPRLDLYAIPG